jgi:hypothetical protein
MQATRSYSAGGGVHATRSPWSRSACDQRSSQDVRSYSVMSRTRKPPRRTLFPDPVAVGHPNEPEERDDQARRAARWPVAARRAETTT